MGILDLDHVREIGAVLRRNRVRTLLTAFGVFWGIFMLVLLLGSGAGLENGATHGFAGEATNSFYVWAQRTTKPYRGLKAGRSLELSSEDVEAVRRSVPDAALVAPRGQLGGYGGGNNVTRGTRSGGFSVVGDVAEYTRVEPVKVAAGRFLDPLDLAESRKVAVIGSRVREVLFERGEDPIGQHIRINGVYFKVVGALRSEAGGDEGGRDAETIHVPFTTFQRAFNQGDRVGWLAVLSRDGVPASRVEEQVLALLRSRHRVAPDDARAFGHWNTEEEYLRIQGLFRGISWLVWVVGAGTLGAGVVGVSNIMLVIVKERTREIGIRRAVGATPLAVAGQIVVEALALTGAAGYAGLIAGMLAVDGARALLRSSGGGAAMFRDPDVGIASALQALAVLVVAGTLAGLLPARRATSIRTAEALRAE